VSKLRDTLCRLGIAELASFIGDETVRVLELLGLENITASRLADLVIKQRSVEDLLLDRITRRDILNALPREDADNLGRLLSLELSGNPWEALGETRFRQGTLRTEVLFSFFGYSVPDTNNEESLSKEITIVEPEYNLFDHQAKACREAISILQKGTYPRVLLHMPTGSGKTRTAMNIISYFLRYSLPQNSVVVWLAHSEELCEQAAEEFEKAWSKLGNRQITVFRCFGPHRVEFDRIQDGILIGGLQLLYQRSISDQTSFLSLSQRVPLIIMDEAHQAIAPTYQQLLNILSADPRTAILGLSATPGRSTLDTQEDLKLAQFFNRQKVTLNIEGYDSPIDYLQKEGYLAEVITEILDFLSDEDFELLPEEKEKLRITLDLPDSVIRRLGADHKRNFLIITRLIEEIQNDNKILVFACSVKHAHLLANILSAKGIRAAAITSKTKSIRRRILIDQYRNSDDVQILINYRVLTTGFDAPKTNIAMITRPTQSVVLYSQMVGRASRGPKAGGNKKCKIITIVDQIPGFRALSEAFAYWDDLWE